MNILITGASGFIGRYLLKALLVEGHHCRCLVRASRKLDVVFEHENIELFQGDITKPETLENIGTGIEAVYHLAAAGHVAAVSAEAEKSFFELNVDGTVNLIKACAKGDVKRFFHFSSTAAIGLPRVTVIDETVECRPQTPYQKSKYQSEIAAFETGKENGIDVAVLRPCMVYGPGGEGEFLKFCRLIKKGVFPRIGLGKNLTPIVHVEDVVQAAVKALDNAVPGEVYFIASETSPKLSEIHRLICQAMHIKRFYFYVPLLLAYIAGYFFEKVSLINGKPPLVSRRNIISTSVDRTFDILKAKSRFGYNPSMDIENQIPTTVKWFQKTGRIK